MRLDRRRPAPRPRPPGRCGRTSRPCPASPCRGAGPCRSARRGRRRPSRAIGSTRGLVHRRRSWCGRRSRSRACRRTRRGPARRTASSPAGTSSRCRRRSAGRRGTPGAPSPSQVPSSSTFCRSIAGAARPQRVAGAVGAAHLDLQGEHVAGADVLDPAQHLLGVQVVQRAELVVGTPLAPVGRRVGTEELVHRRGVGHRRLLTSSTVRVIAASGCGRSAASLGCDESVTTGRSLCRPSRTVKDAASDVGGRRAAATPRSGVQRRHAAVRRRSSREKDRLPARSVLTRCACRVTLRSRWLSSATTLDSGCVCS